MNTEIKFPLNSFFGGRHMVVVGYFEHYSPNELMDGKYYVFNNKIWQYRKKIPSRLQESPMISYDKEFNIITISSILGDDITLDRVVNDRLNIICERTDEDADFGKDIGVSAMASSTSVYEPEILESDDFLKRLIKTVFSMKKVPTTKYRKKLSKTYAFSNLFQGLNASTKISTTVWQTWIEILGIDCVIILKDDGTDNEDPINDYIVYKSRNDSLEIVEKDKINQYLSDNL